MHVEEQILEKYRKAGKIHKHVRSAVKEQLRPGAKILDIAEFIEQEIAKQGGKPAFPVNISINDFAAHYTPVYKDEKVIEKKDLVKIDIGVHVNGYIADGAFTYCSEKHEFIACAEEAVEAALGVIKPGIAVGAITEVIEQTVKEKGLGLIVNLTGHTLDQYVAHGMPSVPNTGVRSSHTLKEGDVIALEPFVTQNNAYVKDSSITEIFNFLMNKPVRLLEARKILAMAHQEYHELPFAKRWLYKRFSPIKVSLSLRQLEAVGALHAHPVLKGPDKRPIAQHEHTVIVADPPLVTTK
jgi:methionyl aminopeptidase